MSGSRLDMRLALLAGLVMAWSGCKPEVRNTIETPPEQQPMTTQRTTDPQTAAHADAPPEETPRDPDPVAANQVVFIAKPKPFGPLDCATFDTPEAPHRRVPAQMYDATDFPERFRVFLEIVEVLQSSSIGLPRPQVQGIGDDDAPLQGAVAFALGRGAFPYAKDHIIDPAVYNARYCERLNKLISARFLVVHAYPVYVDHGNGDDKPWEDLGTDAGKANAGFDTLEEAQAYAAALLKSAPSTPP